MYKLHKLVLHEYNNYIDEISGDVKNISNRLSRYDKTYPYIKNTEKKSRNLFPSFKNKLNEILLNHADEFGFKNTQKNQLKKINRKKMRFMSNKLYEEFRQFKKNNPNNICLDLKEYPPVEINKIEKKNINLKDSNSISMHYDLSKFKTIEGIY